MLSRLFRDLAILFFLLSLVAFLRGVNKAGNASEGELLPVVHFFLFLIITSGVFSWMSYKEKSHNRDDWFRKYMPRFLVTQYDTEAVSEKVIDRETAHILEKRKKELDLEIAQLEATISKIRSSAEYDDVIIENMRAMPVDDLLKMAQTRKAEAEARRENIQADLDKHHYENEIREDEASKRRPTDN